MTIDDYFREYSTFHVKKATELLQPLHVPGQDPLPDFSDISRQPFEPQAHVIAAAIKMLDETRRGMIVSECGTGKTVMGMLTIHQHAQQPVRKEVATATGITERSCSARITSSRNGRLSWRRRSRTSR